MRDRRLRQLHPPLDVAGSEPRFLVQGASAFFLERAQNPAPSGVGNGLQEAIEMGSGVRHDQEG